MLRSLVGSEMCIRDSNKSDQGHSGLGLSIAKQIIDAHDGYISADNVIEGGNIMGAKFIVNLPLAD